LGRAIGRAIGTDPEFQPVFGIVEGIKVGDFFANAMLFIECANQNSYGWQIGLGRGGRALAAAANGGQ